MELNSLVFQKANKITALNFKNVTFTIAPNPAKENVSILYDGLESNPTIEIFDLTGRLIASFNTNDHERVSTINTSQYPAGIYIVVLKVKDTIVSQQKLILE